MFKQKNKKTILERALLFFGLSPTPHALFISRVLLIVFCVFGMFYLNTQSQTAEKYGNRDQLLKEYPDLNI